MVTENTARYSIVRNVAVVRQVDNNLAVAILFLNWQILFFYYKNWMKSILFSYTNKHPNVQIYFEGILKNSIHFSHRPIFLSGSL